MDDAAETLTQELGGNRSDHGRLARSLHLLAQEIASLVAARPDSRSLEHVQHAIDTATAAQSGAQNVASVVRTIDQAAAMIAGSKL